MYRLHLQPIVKKLI